MKQVQILGTVGSKYNTSDGLKIAIGNAEHRVGSVAWCDGDYLVGGREESSRIAYVPDNVKYVITGAHIDYSNNWYTYDVDIYINGIMTKRVEDIPIPKTIPLMSFVTDIEIFIVSAVKTNNTIYIIQKYNNWVSENGTSTISVFAIKNKTLHIKTFSSSSGNTIQYHGCDDDLNFYWSEKRKVCTLNNKTVTINCYLWKTNLDNGESSIIYQQSTFHLPDFPADFSFEGTGKTLPLHSAQKFNFDPILIDGSYHLQERYGFIFTAQDPNIADLGWLPPGGVTASFNFNDGNPHIQFNFDVNKSFKLDWPSVNCFEKVDLNGSVIGVANGSEGDSNPNFPRLISHGLWVNRFDTYTTFNTRILLDNMNGSDWVTRPNENYELDHGDWRGNRLARLYDNGAEVYGHTYREYVLDNGSDDDNKTVAKITLGEKNNAYYIEEWKIKQEDITHPLVVGKEEKNYFIDRSYLPYLLNGPISNPEAFKFIFKKPAGRDREFNITQISSNVNAYFENQLIKKTRNQETNLLDINT